MTDIDSFIYIVGAVIVWIGAGAILCRLLPWDNR